MPNAFFSEGTKEFVAHVSGAAKAVVKVGAEVVKFVEDEASKLVGLKDDAEKVASDGVAELALVETGNAAGAVAALPAAEVDVAKLVSDAKVVLADAKAATAANS